MNSYDSIANQVERGIVYAVCIAYSVLVFAAATKLILGA